MPARNIVKEYLPDSYYHIYNRGVEKRIIFQDEADYKVFLSYLKLYLSPPPELPKEISDQYRAIAEKLQLNNYCNEIKLSAFCLIPNHFHLLIKQNPVNGINRFMQSLCTKYSMYFNKKHKRIGKLFQGHYKAVLVKTEEQLLHLSRYIHLNPVANLKLNSSQINQKLATSYSSYADFLNLRNTSWINKKEILQYFKSSGQGNSYKSFVEHHYQNPSTEIINKLVLE